MRVSSVPRRFFLTRASATGSLFLHEMSTGFMQSRWAIVDSLMREIGALRNEARALDPRSVDEAIVAEVDRFIAEAAQAIDDTIVGPEEDEAPLIGACEAIVVARNRIEALRATLKRSSQIVERSIELRKQSGRQLYDALKTQGGTKLL